LSLAFDIAQRFSGIEEMGGKVDNPAIMAMLKLDNSWPDHDEVPWCSAFVNYVCWLLRLPRSKSLMARSWLEIGVPIRIEDAKVGDIVIFNRGGSPDPAVIMDKGHVGFYAGLIKDDGVGTALVEVLGGNQGDTVKISRYHESELLGVRRLT
jgi:uncharacterized protein (TIGR02594 family)